MTNGIIAALNALNIFTVSGMVVFSEETQRYLFTRLTRKSAAASGIRAIADAGLAEGDLNALARIAAIAAELEEDLEAMAGLTGLIALSPPSPTTPATPTA